MRRNSVAFPVSAAPADAAQNYSRNVGILEFAR